MQCVTGERLSSASVERLQLPDPSLIPFVRRVNTNASDIESPKHQKSR